jgi:hypothetical protein
MVDVELIMKMNSYTEPFSNEEAGIRRSPNPLLRFTLSIPVFASDTKEKEKENCLPNRGNREHKRGKNGLSLSTRSRGCKVLIRQLETLLLAFVLIPVHRKN